MNTQELAKLAIQNENTPELGQYWQKRYEKFLKNNVFILSEQTEALLESKEPIDSPATPYGFLNLPVFVSKNKVVDEVMLQNCIETSVRFLDSLLEIINFTPDVKKVIFQNRKIGLSITKFDEYLTLRDITVKVDEIDYLGEIISSSSYRASEALAEEKGPCENWNQIAFMIRPKAFEYWYNSETGEVKSGLDIAEEYTSTNLLSSNFEIIPRRNSNILLYPDDLEWQIWSDRDDNSVMTLNAQEVDQDMENIEYSINQNEEEFDHSLSNQAQSVQDSQSIGQKPNPDESLPTKPKKQPKHEQFGSPAPISDLPLINPISTLQKKISGWFAIDPNLTNPEPENKIDLSKDLSEHLEKTPNDILIPKSEEAQSIDKNKFDSNQEPLSPNTFEPIIQIKEVIKEVLIEVIKEVEVTKEVEKFINKPIIIQIVSLSSEAKKILVGNDGHLPTIEYTFGGEFESEIIQKTKQNYGLQINFMEISSIDFFGDQLYIAYQAKVQVPSDDNVSLRYNFVEALTREQDTVAYSKSIDRVHRWQQSARIKAQELLKEYNQNPQNQFKESESKIIAQKNLFIEDLQSRIQKLSVENGKIGIQKDQQIQTLKNDLQQLQLTQIQQIQTPIVTKVASTIQPSNNFSKDNSLEISEVVLVKNDDLVFDLSPQPTIPNPPIPTININTNTMPHSQNNVSEVDSNQASFRTSRDKMFMPTLEIETKLGVPVIVNAHRDDDDVIVDQPKIVEDSNPKSPNHAGNVLLKLKRLTR